VLGIADDFFGCEPLLGTGDWGLITRFWPIGGCGDPHEKSQVDN
jgi:hypothetical protein